MSYELIDKTLERWSLDRGLCLQSCYKDCDVRSFEIYNEDGRKFQIWIDLPDQDLVKVHAWDYKKKRKDWLVRIGDLYPTLDLAFCLIREWK